MNKIEIDYQMKKLEEAIRLLELIQQANRRIDGLYELINGIGGHFKSLKEGYLKQIEITEFAKERLITRYNNLLNKQ